MPGWVFTHLDTTSNLQEHSGELEKELRKYETILEDTTISRSVEERIRGGASLREAVREHLDKLASADNALEVSPEAEDIGLLVASVNEESASERRII